MGYIDNDEAVNCWHCGNTPAYFDHQGDHIRCGECDKVLWDDDAEPVHEDPDPDFHDSNFYDIHTSRR